jgi:uncharacterized protein YegL
LSSLAGNLIIDDEMGTDILYVSGSANPAALAEPDRLRWGRSVLPSSGITLTYRILPQRVGLLPTNKQAVASYTDGDGAQRQFVFPVPEIEVVAPTPKPTVTPTPTPVPRHLYLPVLEKGHCWPGIAHADVVLLMDTSSSMAEGTKLIDARTAAARFVQLLDLPQDQAAIVGFDQDARVLVDLTGQRQALLDAIGRLTTRTGTMIDRALLAAVEQVRASPNRRAANRAVIVLLSDGGHRGARQDVLIARDAARQAGAMVITIGLGTDADHILLQEVAEPSRYYFAPDPGALKGIYELIAVTIPCR